MLESERRLAAIMFTDMVGYTSLAQRNERLALELLEEHKRLVRPFFPKHQGREIKTIGDGFLVEFSSAVEAVRSALDIQQSLHGLNSNRTSEKRIIIRIGIHVGDVVHSKNDVFGDAVNVASRIEPLAEPGGICITRQVHDNIRNNVEVPMMALGKRELKNVDVPMEVYKMVMPWERETPQVQEPLDRKRLAVMPLTSMISDPDDAYFADGMTEEMISTISKIRDLHVIARTSVMQYRQTTKRVADIGRELRVGCVLEGSVRKAGNRLRVTVQLIDTQSEEHLWSESYDRELQDVFAIQSDVSQRVAEALKVQLLANDRQKIQKVPTSSIEAYTLYLKGRYYWNERTLQGLKKGISYFEQAIKRDPKYALAYAGLADCYIILENWGFLHPREAVPKAKTYATKALELDDSLAEAHTSLAAVLASFLWDWQGAEREFKRAIELNPNYATAHHWYGHGVCEARKRFDEAVKEMREAQKLDPLSMIIAANVGDALFASGRYDEAVEQYRKVIEMDPDFAYAHVRLGVTLVSRSILEKGTAEIEKAVSLSPESTEMKADLAYAYARSGRTGEAERLLAELREISKKRYVSAPVLASVDATLGRREQAFEWLARAVEDHSSTLPMNINEPMFDNLRSDSRFESLLRTIGLE